MSAPARPPSITLIAWLMIVAGVLTMGLKSFVLLSPEALALTRDLLVNANNRAFVTMPLSAHLAYSFVSSGIFVVAGAFMLKGRNWARLLLLIWPLTALALTFAVTGLSPALALKTLTYGVLAFFLLRAASVQYFRASAAQPVPGAVKP